MEQTQASASEAELIKRVCDGDRDAFYEWVRPHERLVYATAFSILKNPGNFRRFRAAYYSQQG
jgi:hypothetical protein